MFILQIIRHVIKYVKLLYTHRYNRTIKTFHGFYSFLDVYAAAVYSNKIVRVANGLLRIFYAHNEINMENLKWKPTRGLVVKKHPQTLEVHISIENRNMNSNEVFFFFEIIAELYSSCWSNSNEINKAQFSKCWLLLGIKKVGRVKLIYYTWVTTAIRFNSVFHIQYECVKSKGKQI